MQLAWGAGGWGGGLGRSGAEPRAGVPLARPWNRLPMLCHLAGVMTDVLASLESERRRAGSLHLSTHEPGWHFLIGDGLQHLSDTGFGNLKH